MATSQFGDFAKVVREYSTVIGSSTVVFATVGVEQITAVTIYRCPCVDPSTLATICVNFSEFSPSCTAPLNLAYGLSLILTPALALFLIGIIINPNTWKTLTGCLQKSPQYKKKSTDLSWTLALVFARALISPLAWICIALLDGAYLACALTHLPYDVGKEDSLYMTCEKLSQAKISYPSNAYQNNKAFSQVLGAATIASLLIIGFVTYCISRCTFPLTYYHAKYYGVYRMLEEAEFEDEMKKKAQMDAEKNVQRFLKERRSKDLWDRISTVFQFQRDKEKLALYSELYCWVMEENLNENSKNKVEKKKPKSKTHNQEMSKNGITPSFRITMNEDAKLSIV